MALPNKTKIPVGTVLQGKYRITREIGRGGMAAVYEAANVDIGKRVAIKVLAQELTTSAVVVERFLREARAAAAIRSPYICDIYDSGKLDDGRPFLVLELLEGESLYERMTKIRWLDIETTTTIVSQVCRGLTKAHAASIVHRDLKPENIFLTKDEESRLLSKILDFGLAKFYAPMETDGPQTRLTREGAVFGTPAYMSPEQVRGQGAVDQRADLWALGCIVYECFTGRTVWSTEQGVAMTFAQIANAPLPRPATYRPDLPETFTLWFDRALNRDISQRFQSAKEFADAFGGVFNHPQIEVSAIGPSPALALPQSVRDSFENPFLPGAPVASPIMMPAGARQVAPDAQTEPPPPRTSAPHPAISRPSGPLSAPSVPVELVNDKGRPSAADPGATGAETAAGPASPRPSKLGFASPEAEGRAQKRPHPLVRAAVFGGGAALVGGIGFLVWTQLVQPATGTGTTPSASVSVAPPTSATVDPSATPSARPLVAEAPLPAWTTHLREGQQAIAAGDLKQATRLLKEAFDRGGGHGVARTMLEHVGVAAATASAGPCKLTGLSRPRAYDLASASSRPVASGRPTIALGPKGAVVAWTDAHEGSEHAYAVTLDEALRDAAMPIDITPEGVNVLRPELDRAADKLVVTYSDGKGPEAGVHARFLDGDGRIAGPAIQVAPPKAGSFWPSLAAAPDGSFFVAWTDEGDADSEDLFFRHLGPALEVSGDVIRATDLVPAGPTKARARFPSIAVAGNALLAAYRFERDPLRLIHQMRVPLADAGKGLAPKKGEKKDRNIGDVVLVNTDKAKADAPSLACGGGACFLTWHAEQNGGAWAAYIDPAAAQPLLRRHFTKTGSHPAVAVSATGQAQVAWFEGGKVVTASITRDGVGSPSRIARVSGDQPTPSITAGGKPGEWYLAWLDYETGHLEAYAARVQCK